MEANEAVQNVWHVENNCFALYLDVAKAEEVRRIYDSILTELSDYCTLSAGVVANSRELFGDENNLYACAEMMLEKAKDVGIQNIVFFSQEDLAERLKTIQFMEEMQASVRKDCEGFYLCYQPQIKSGNYHLFGAEALLRYRSDTCGNIYPDEFIPLLEQSKLIKQVSGRSAPDWIDSFVILEAKNMLKYTDDSIKEIVFKLHFPNPSVFYKFFKAHTGMTPSEYRNG